jgi:hypothetical protein
LLTTHHPLDFQSVIMHHHQYHFVHVRPPSLQAQSCQTFIIIL